MTSSWRWAVLLASVYLLCFVVMSWPLALKIGSEYWTDEGDGLGMIWNLWHASEHPGSTLHTEYALYPDGFRPLLHSYHPLTSWSVGWLPLSLVVRFNLAVLLCFVGSGLSMFALCRHFGATRWGAFVGGFAFTFTGFHWAHAQGHLNLISTQFVPLFALCWFRVMERASWWRSILAALCLLAVLLSDHYLATYCVLLALVVWIARGFEPAVVWRFAVAAALSSGPIVAFMLWSYVREGYAGAHAPSNSPLDPLALFVPGGHWMFASWTRGIWSQFASNVHENDVHLGLAVWAAILWKRQRSIWWLVLAVFGVLALGEELTILGHPTGIPMPYALVSRAIPALRLGGVPVRMAIMVALAAAVLASLAFDRLGRWGRWTFALLVFELLPSPLPHHPGTMPEWVSVLADHPGEGALLDPMSDPRRALYYQTVHGRPVFHCITARFPGSMYRLDRDLRILYRERDFEQLRRMGFGYIRSPKEIEGLELVAMDQEVRLYALP